jgi:hypothetical protein
LWMWKSEGAESDRIGWSRSRPAAFAYDALWNFAMTCRSKTGFKAWTLYPEACAKMHFMSVRNNSVVATKPKSY